MDAPWTRDGRVRADVVAVAPDVSGLVTDVLVHDNQEVKQGRRAVPHRPRALRPGAGAGRGRGGGPQGGARPRHRRPRPLPAAQRQRGLARNGSSRRRRAQQQAEAAYEQSLADRDLAKLNLDRSEVKASVNGTITNMDLQPGEYVAAGKGVMALVDSDTLHVEGYFEETKLPRIHVGDPVRGPPAGRERRT